MNAGDVEDIDGNATYSLIPRSRLRAADARDVWFIDELRVDWQRFRDPRGFSASR
ncbi:MAG: hypothetical protein GQE15_14460 [Archangiaceae bacterium]|nr:hypothetical protein [Archangiaceae bacterium]